MNKFKQATYGLLITTTVASAALIGMAHTVTDLRDDIKILQSDLDYKNERLIEADLELTKAYKRINELTKELDKFVDPIQYDGDPAPLYDIPLSDELQEYTYYTCTYYGIEDYYELVLATMAHESNFDPDAISATQDYGLMQINICNHSDLKKKLEFVDIMDEKSNIECGIYMLSDYLLEYEDPHKALMVYNMGPTNAREQWQRGNYSSVYSRAVLKKLELVSNLKK